jgi:hypothetical protein
MIPPQKNKDNFKRPTHKIRTQENGHRERNLFIRTVTIVYKINIKTSISPYGVGADILYRSILVS